MKKHLFIAICFLSLSLKAQDSTKVESDLKYKIEPGLILGGDYGNGGILFSFIPYISYDLKPNLMLGVSPNLTYFTATNGSFSETMYGGSVFGKLFISKSFYGQLENEVLNRKFTSDPNIQKQRLWINQFMVGGGYRREAIFGYTFISGLIIANYKNYKSPYARPYILRAGVSIRLNSSLFKGL
jgi:hypothetical protein